VDTAADKKAEDVLLLDVSKQSVVTDYFVICSGTSERQLQAISEGILEQARKQVRAKPRDVEGDGSTGWLLLDFGDVIVHIFAPEKREFYNLEELWRDGKVIVRVQ
jgi:ribosome-associated protein